MAATDQIISGLVQSQLPDFVRADHPKFQLFLETYYAWLEDETKGNTVYHIMNAEKYRDIDETLDPFIRILKNELLPYFPEKTPLDLVKILKNAREFYNRKGSEESLKWLFRVLFDQEIEVYYPKQQILIASDGKWKLPKAFQLIISDENANIDPNLLEKRLATGSISKATCTIESANRTIDKNFGTEILEIYVTNVTKEFENGENLDIIYTDENNDEQLFSEKIIGAISAIKLDSTIRNDPLQIKRGLLYNVGDPVVVFGGLDNTAEARDAIAYVGNVSSGSIESIVPTFPGYGYRQYANTIVTVFRKPSDEVNANNRTDIRVVGVNDISIPTDSQASFKELITVDKVPILYLADTLIGDNYDIFTQNNRNIVIQVTESVSTEKFYNYEPVYANGSNYLTANFTAKIATTNADVGFGAGATACTDVLVLYDVQLSNGTSNLNFDTANVQEVLTDLSVGGLICANSGKTFTYDDQSDSHSDLISTNLAANVDSLLLQAFVTEELETGGIALYNLLEGGFGFRSTPEIDITSYYDTLLSEAQKENDSEYLANTLYQLYRQPIGVYGKIAHVYINNPGSNYANGDVIVVSGRGSGFSGYVTVNATGGIIKTTITNRGEGYDGTKTVTITSSGGSNGSLTAYGFGEGVTNQIDTGAIGRIRDIRVESRGFDYINTPIVSLKVVDMMITTPTGDISEGDIVYQGSSLDRSIFQGKVKNYDNDTGKLRLFNYSGNSFSNFNSTLPFKKYGSGVTFSVDVTKVVPAPEQYSTESIESGLPNPYFYGNGRARGVAEFFNGLINYPGFYVNTDGFLSADKKMQDGKTYHNYSYVIESGNSYKEYKNAIDDIIHPIGTVLLAKLVANNDLAVTTTPNNVVYFSLPGPGAVSNITIDDSTANIVIGQGTEWTSNANNLVEVGDIILLKDSTHPLRNQAKLVTVVTSDTELETESNWSYIGQGKISSYVEFETQTGTVLVNPPVTGTVEINSPISALGSVNRSSNVIWTGTGGGDFTSELFVGDVITINNQTRYITIIANADYAEVNSVFRFSGTDQSIYLSSNVVTGDGTNFDPEISVGDIITINNEVREVTVRNSASDTQLEVNTPFLYYATGQSLYLANNQVLGSSTDFDPEISVNDYIRVNNQIRQVISRTSDTLLTVNAAFDYYGTSNVIERLANTEFRVYGNTNPVNQFVANGDIISINIAAANLFMAQTGSVQVSASDEEVIGTATAFDTELQENDIISINNQIRKVVDISSATVMNVNSAFSGDASAQFIYKLATLVQANVGINGNTMSSNVTINSNLANLVYSIAPDYSSSDYDYEIITVTD